MRGMQQHRPSFVGEPSAPHPQMFRASAAAARAGVDVRTFINACKTGDIPIRIERVGHGLFVRVAEFEAWIAPQTSNVDLFRA